MDTLYRNAQRPVVIAEGVRLNSTLERDEPSERINLALDYRARLKAKARAKRWNKLRH